MARYVGPHERRARIEDALIDWYRCLSLANRAAEAPNTPRNQELFERLIRRHVEADQRLRRLARDSIAERRRSGTFGQRRAVVMRPAPGDWQAVAEEAVAAP